MKNLKINDVKIISKSQQKFISGSFNQDHFDCIWTCGAMYGGDAEAEYRCVARCARFL